MAERIERVRGAFDPYDREDTVFKVRVVLNRRPSKDWVEVFEAQAQVEQTARRNAITMERSKLKLPENCRRKGEVENRIALEAGSMTVTFEAEEGDIREALRKIDAAIDRANRHVDERDRIEREAEERARKTESDKAQDLNRVRNLFRDA